MNARPKKAPMGRVMDAMEIYEGWCVACGDFTTSECEPDARKRPCEVCGQRTVYGAEELLFMGLVDTSEAE